MPKPMTLNVRVSGLLGEFVASQVGGNGAYENVSEYVRDLIRRDKAGAEEEAFRRLQAELQRSFSASESSYRAVNADTIISRRRRRSTG